MALCQQTEPAEVISARERNAIIFLNTPIPITFTISYTSITASLWHPSPPRPSHTYRFIHQHHSIPMATISSPSQSHSPSHTPASQHPHGNHPAASALCRQGPLGRGQPPPLAAGAGQLGAGVSQMQQTSGCARNAELKSPSEPWLQGFLAFQCACNSASSLAPNYNNRHKSSFSEILESYKIEDLGDGEAWVKMWSKCLGMFLTPLQF
eukprot:1159328-Pelagomonas_calceolata.AAC.8